MEGYDPVFVEENEFRSTGTGAPSWAVLPPLPPLALTAAPAAASESERLRVAYYETVNTQLPPLYMYMSHQPLPAAHFAFPSQFPNDDFPSPSLGPRPRSLAAPLPGCTTSPSSHDPFSSDHLRTGADDNDDDDGLTLSSIPTLAGPSISISSSSAAPRANHDSLPFAQPQHLPSLPQLRLPADFPEPPAQLPDTLPIGSPPGSGQDFLDYMTHFCSARYSSALQELNNFAYAATNDLLSPTLLIHPELYRNDDSSPFTADPAFGAQSQLPVTDAEGDDLEIAGLTTTEPDRPPNANMPSTSRLSEASRPAGIRKRPLAEAAESSLKRRRTPAATSSRTRSWIEPNRTRFGPSSTARTGSVGDTKSGFGDDDEDDVQIIDLSNTETVPEELLRPAVDNSTKLSGYECIICMDRCTDITVTHCGK